MSIHVFALLCVLPLDAPVSVEGCVWDNDLRFNKFSARAISPPNFPDIRVVDDFLVQESECRISNIQIHVIEDTGWTDGGQITVSVYADTGGEGPGTELARVERGFTKIDTGVDYFGSRHSYEYWIEDVNIDLVAGNYWLGVRNAGGGGRGTNYWMTSDGGVDGPTSDTGWFSLNRGETFMPEGAGWHHAFTINLDRTEWACCTHGQCAMKPRHSCETTCRRDPRWVCDGDVDGDGQVNPVDAGLVQAAFGSIRERDMCNYDLDCDGRINPVDVGIVQSLFGVCNDPRSTCGAGVWFEGVNCRNLECP